jgi:hypothetical protein
MVLLPFDNCAWRKGSYLGTVLRDEANWRSWFLTQISRRNRYCQVQTGERQDLQEAATNVASESIKVEAAEVMEQKADSRNHHCFYRADRKDVEEMHVVLPFDELIQCMDQNFVCSLVERVTVEIATSLIFIGCGETCSMKARLRNNGIDSNYEDY